MIVEKRVPQLQDTWREEVWKRWKQVWLGPTTEVKKEQIETKSEFKK